MHKDKLHLQPHKTKGLFITFCGLDGCGKTTMIQRLTSYLQEKQCPVLCTKQPTPFLRESEIFRTFMDQEDHSAFDYRCLSLMAAGDRIQHVNKVILPALRAGKCVISDRYLYSWIATLRARGYVRDRWTDEIASYMIQPDFAFFIDVPVQTAVARVRSRTAERDRYIDMELQYKLRRQYCRIARQNRGIILPSLESEDAVFSQILEQIERHRWMCAANLRKEEGK